MDKKVMILGSTGLLGTALERVCDAVGINYAALSHEDFEITEQDDLARVVEENNPDVVINTVAMIGIKACEENPKRTLAVNTMSVFDLAKICENEGRTLVQASTHAVFDGRLERPYIESDIPSPINIYGISKLAGEHFVRTNVEKHYIVRFPTMYGPRRNSALGFVDKMINLMKEGKELRVADDRIDSPTYSLHAANELISLVQKDRPFGVYHVANMGSVSYYDFVVALAEKIGFRGEIKRAKDADFPAPAPNPLMVNLMSSKLRPLADWREALKGYVKSEGIKC